MVLIQADKIMSSNTTPHISLVTTVRQVRVIIEHAYSFLQTLYLFTKNDFLTFAIPTALFAFFGTLSGPTLTSNPSPSLSQTIFRVPSALLIVWSNLLVFDISNQRLPSAVEEDKVNKPHRPLPSGRITSEATRRLLLFGIPFVLALGWYFSCWQETLLLNTAIWMYNDLGGCDEDWVLRNLLIAVGYGLYSSAALRVLAGPDYAISEKGFQWVVLVTLVMFVTQHICDIKDVEGDRLRGRKSAPIMLGDKLVRWSVAVPIILCSVACPMFFGVGVLGYALTLPMGMLVAGRTMAFRDLRADKLTWKLWALWTCGLFVLPLVKQPAVLEQAWKTLVRALCPGGDCSGSLNLVAVSSVALIIEGRRLYGSVGGAELPGNNTVPRIVIDRANLQ